LAEGATRFVDRDRDLLATRPVWLFSSAPIGPGTVELMPAAWDALPAGDFRDWPAIDARADGVATELGVTAADASVAERVGVYGAPGYPLRRQPRVSRKESRAPCQARRDR